MYIHSLRDEPLRFAVLEALQCVHRQVRVVFLAELVQCIEIHLRMTHMRFHIK